MNLMQGDECRSIIESVPDEAWTAARVRTRSATAAVATVERSASTVTLPEEAPAWALLHGRIHNVVRPLVYRIWRRDFVDHSSINLVRYEEGGFYRAHTDSGRFSKTRYITILCYLNDDFEGGGTYFPNGDVEIHPEAGKAVLFPSDYLHRANTVENGQKYIALSWLVAPPPIAWI